jgi:hypothetical protein
MTPRPSVSDFEMSSCHLSSLFLEIVDAHEGPHGLQAYGGVGCPAREPAKHDVDPYNLEPLKPRFEPPSFKGPKQAPLLIVCELPLSLFDDTRRGIEHFVVLQARYDDVFESASRVTQMSRVVPGDDYGRPGLATLSITTALTMIAPITRKHHHGVLNRFTAVFLSLCSDYLRGIAQREVIVFPTHFEVALVLNHAKVASSGSQPMRVSYSMTTYKGSIGAP